MGDYRCNRYLFALCDLQIENTGICQKHKANSPWRRDQQELERVLELPLHSRLHFVTDLLNQPHPATEDITACLKD